MALGGTCAKRALRVLSKDLNSFFLQFQVTAIVRFFVFVFLRFVVLCVSSLLSVLLLSLLLVLFLFVLSLSLFRLLFLFSLFLLLCGLSLLELGLSCVVPPTMTAELYGNILHHGLELFSLVFEPKWLERWKNLGSNRP